MRESTRLTLNLLLGVALVTAVLITARDAVRSSSVDADLEITIGEAREVAMALAAYKERTGAYPEAHGEDGLDTRTLEPMRKRGYYSGHISSLLKDGRIDAYDSPDDRGTNQEYWLEMSLRRDPSIRLLIVNSDDAPLSGGRWRDGVYVWRRGRLSKV